MARLYATISDEKNTVVHKIGQTELVINVYYGSKQDSKQALGIHVTYSKSAEKPQITLFKYIPIQRVYE